MLCFKSLSSEEAYLRKILGPVNNDSVEEMKIFNHVLELQDDDDAVRHRHSRSKRDSQNSTALLSSSMPENQMTNSSNSNSIEVTQSMSSSNVLCNLPQGQESETTSLFIPNTPLPPFIFQQTYSRWKDILDYSFYLYRWKSRRTIYILPMEPLPEFIDEMELNGEIGFCRFLKQFAEVFFMGLDVQVLPEFDMTQENWNIKSRYHSVTKEKQFLVSDLNKSVGRLLPKDGFCMLGVTWTDLYPCEDLNFVLGEADFRPRSCIMSFGRFEPKAYKDGVNQTPVTSINGDLLWKLAKVMTHEVCHLFGLRHCVFFACLMNESTSVEEAITQPMTLCPVCLKKIQKVCKFDMVQRYKNLLQFCQTVQEKYPNRHLKNAIDWYVNCLTYLGR